MKERFDGVEGKRRLIEALKQQRLVEHEAKLAEMLADAGEVTEFSPGDLICEQGAADNHVYFIIAGEASVFVNDRYVSSRLVKEAIGEMAAFDPTAPRSATVRAKALLVALRV